MNKIVERLSNLRNLMNEYNIDCVIVPTNDYHSSEYIADFFKEREYITGFTGSAGTAIILKDKAGLWTDGRYFLQAEEELKDSTVTLFKDGEKDVLTMFEYLVHYHKQIKTVALYGKLVNTSFILALNKVLDEYQMTLRVDLDLVGMIWSDRPKQVFNDVYDYSIEYCGEERLSKINKVKRHIKRANADGLVISLLDDIAWLYNLRGTDVHCNPVFQSYTLFLDNKVYLYVNTKSLKVDLGSDIIVKEYDELYNDLKLIKNKTIILDKTKVNYLIYELLKDNAILNERNVTTDLKAVKNNVEIEYAYSSHVKDAIAVTKFIYDIKKNVKNSNYTELSLSKKLLNYRMEQPLFKDISFDTIVGYKEHGAIIHYEPTEETDVPVYDKSLLLVDSGAQFLGGTTDITRTIAMGELTDEEKKVYTLVLKAHLALGDAKMKVGSNGQGLDILTRQVLSDYGYEYNHGTGHGVGSFLNVHEGPQSISKRATNMVQFLPGMITSNEPGVYLENKFGVRIENLILCKKNNDELYFDTLTLVPYEVDAIDTSLLNEHEKELIHNYHIRVYNTLKDYLDKDILEWLEGICNAI